MSSYILTRLVNGVAIDYIVDYVPVPKPPVVPNPGYFRKLRTGAVLPVTNWERTFHTVSPGTVDISTVREYKTSGLTETASWSGQYACYRPVSPTELSVTSSERNALIHEARGKAATAGWDVGTTALEANKTYDLLRHAHTRTFARADAILSRKVAPVKTVAEFASAWMEARYGWRILMYDLESADEAVQRFQNRTSLDRYTTYHSKQRTSEYASTPNMPDRSAHFYTGGNGGAVINPANPHLNGSSNWTTTHKLEVRVGAGYNVSRTFAGVAINPALTAWELTPYSFIIDWFVDIGSLLSSVVPTLGRSLAYTWESQKRTVTTVAQPAYRPKSDDRYSRFYMSGSVSPAKWETVFYTRKVVTGSVPPAVRVNPRLNFLKFGDLAALTALKSRHRMSRLQPLRI